MERPLKIIIGYRDLGGSEVKVSACNMGDLGSIPGWGRSLGEGNGNPLQYSCLENPMDGGAWWTIVHGVAKSRTQLSNFTSLLHRDLEVRAESAVTLLWGTCRGIDYSNRFSIPGEKFLGRRKGKLQLVQLCWQDQDFMENRDFRRNFNNYLI